jgi:hypothetical protein
MSVKLGLSHLEKHRLTELENAVLRRIFGPKTVWEAGEYCIIWSFINFTIQKILLG